MESPPPSRTDPLPPARRARRGRWAGRFGRARCLTVTTPAGTGVAPVTAAAAASERSAPPAAISSTACERQHHADLISRLLVEPQGRLPQRIALTGIAEEV